MNALETNPGSAGSGVADPVHGEKLRPGRHNLTRDDVVNSQRGRLLFACLEAIAAKGYGVATVTDIIERASVSRRTFYELFPTKEDCFFSAFQRGSQIAAATIDAALLEAAARDGREYLRVSLTSYLTLLSANPAHAKAMKLDSLAAGPLIYELRNRFEDQLAARLAHAYQLIRAEDRRRPPLPEVAYAILVGGFDDQIRRHLLEGDPAEVADLAEPFIATALALFGDSADGYGLV